MALLPEDASLIAEASGATKRMGTKEEQYTYLLDLKRGSLV